MNTEKITINTFEDVMKVNGIESRKDYAEISDPKEQEHLKQKWEWEQIVAAYNKQRDPEFNCDPTNHDQYKYFPGVRIVKDSSQPSGFAFSDTYYGCTSAAALVGSRLVFAHEDDVIDALEKFGQTFIRYTMS